MEALSPLFIDALCMVDHIAKNVDDDFLKAIVNQDVPPATKVVRLMAYFQSKGFGMNASGEYLKEEISAIVDVFDLILPKPI